ncbi:MAG: hypothetical protein ACREFP_00655 [Acetobacteraceae bacterium]
MNLSRRVFLAAPLAPFGLAAPLARVDLARGEVPADFTGLSFETSELLRGSLLAPANAALVGLVRRLGGRGVIRLGGNSSDRAHGHPSAAAIAELGGFLRAVGWSLLYGLDLGNATPEEAAHEAAAVAQAAGPALIAFQLGNEPDLFNRGLRAASWDFADYLASWERFAAAVLARLPAAHFAGPDIAYRASWMEPFARNARPHPRLLTRHFYAEGPGSSPAVTIARLLDSGPELDAALVPAEQAARAAGIPLRMSETNSVYDGGRLGVSNTLAAACWGAELMFRLAARGWTGVNFHDRPTRSYAPIGATRPLAKPLYYGMLLFAAAKPRRVSFRGGHAKLRHYRVEGRDGRTRLAFFNLDPTRSVIARFSGPRPSASALRLAASAPASSTVTLGGASVADDGAWLPRWENVRAAIELAPASALIVTLG